MTAYLPFHPGGEDELMRVAGRDGTKLFSESWQGPGEVLRLYFLHGVTCKGYFSERLELTLPAVLTHSWVNMDYMLQECMVGVMVRG
jgi:cytochrome b involved in lipid metabolism